MFKGEVAANAGFMELAPVAGAEGLGATAIPPPPLPPQLDKTNTVNIEISAFIFKAGFLIFNERNSARRKIAADKKLVSC